MDIRGYHWKLWIHWYPQVSMDFHWYHGYALISMYIHGFPWKSSDIHPWNTMDPMQPYHGGEWGGLACSGPYSTNFDIICGCSYWDFTGPSCRLRFLANSSYDIYFDKSRACRFAMRLFHRMTKAEFGSWFVLVFRFCPGPAPVDLPVLRGRKGQGGVPTRCRSRREQHK